MHLKISIYCTYTCMHVYMLTVNCKYTLIILYYSFIGKQASPVETVPCTKGTLTRTQMYLYTRAIN